MAAKTRVFVSHSSEDNAFTRRLVADLTAVGAEVWVDFDYIRHGDFVQRINEGFQGRQWFVLVLSPSAVRSSWVPKEVNAAMSLVTEGRLRDIVGIVAKPVKQADLPALWVNLQRYDATYDYARAVRNVVATIGLGSTVPDKGSHLIVDPNRSGGFKTLAAALEAADPGDEIAVYPAVYTEALTFEKPVHLIGQGKPEEIIIAPPNKAGMIINSKGVRFTGISVWIGAPREITDLVKRDNLDKAGKTTSIALTTLFLAGFVALGLSPIVVAGPAGWALWMLGKEFRRKEPIESSIQVKDDASLELQECGVRNSLGSGIRISGQLTLSSSRVFACDFDGISILAGSQATIEDSEIVANRVNGIRVSGSATIRRNKITGNKGVGIRVDPLASGAWFDNILGGNRWGAVTGNDEDLAKITRERNAE